MDSHVCQTITHQKYSLYCDVMVTAGEQERLPPSVCPWTTHDLSLPLHILCKRDFQTITLRSCDLVWLLSIDHTGCGPCKSSGRLSRAINSCVHYRFAISLCIEGNKPNVIRGFSCMSIFFLCSFWTLWPISSGLRQLQSLLCFTDISRRVVKNRREVLLMSLQRNGRRSTAGFCFTW